MSEKMHYFKAVRGRACPRYGTDSFIGCRRGPKGFVWADGAVVAITDNEVAPNRKAYREHLRLGDLMPAIKADYTAWTEAREKASAEKRAKRDADREKQQADAEASAVESIDSTPDGADERAVG